MTIKVVVLHPHTGGNKMWEHLKTNWKLYGDMGLVITIYRNFSYEMLEIIQPDVIILGDCAGAPYQFTEQEFESIEMYMNEGINKHIIGTYATFYHQEGPFNRLHIYDNRRLCTLFGIEKGLVLTTRRIEGEITYINSDKTILWKNIPLPYKSNGYTSSQVPLHELKWIDETGKLIGCSKDTKILAQSENGGCVILERKTERMSSLFISHMPEYESVKKDFVDCQFLYNCILYLVQHNYHSSLTLICLNEINKHSVPIRELNSLPQPLIELKKKLERNKKNITYQSNP
ncbi:hypothetical protein EDI_145830 [Entamoeba dispar SAW760]|uniref:Uncharacterized protein n=1 Tax=Entamoeba dispar (strain ATCC PRA-260 / SAW760) TaxID=370354 RepID=B0EU96_ENTDS|nr:uncharacterized protein EDI_145830 [Entamoeba dispar SAW760]EDR21885.1 hypothetical protein EDI_145830 [Entamoeba dispar SAW760]|eukprot:EDR21885.1 hypothetical protein EDI_145830 [Entamoeba dispar SAW760]